ncbi:unnamed protein product [Rhizophagus irregularis]|nr:unnamed protein product [Rhizophagus irregularis]
MCVVLLCSSHRIYHLNDGHLNLIIIDEKQHYLSFNFRDTITFDTIFIIFTHGRQILTILCRPSGHTVLFFYLK